MNRLEILDAAHEAVAKDRSATHGEPERNFDNIAGFWNQFLGSRLKVNITGSDVAVMMALLKVARIASNPKHPDNYVDGSGYFACAGEIATKAASTCPKCGNPGSLPGMCGPCAFHHNSQIATGGRE